MVASIVILTANFCSQIYHKVVLNITHFLPVHQIKLVLLIYSRLQLVNVVQFQEKNATHHITENIVIPKIILSPLLSLKVVHNGISHNVDQLIAELHTLWDQSAVAAQ